MHVTHTCANLCERVNLEIAILKTMEFEEPMVVIWAQVLQVDGTEDEDVPNFGQVIASVM